VAAIPRRVGEEEEVAGNDWAVRPVAPETPPKMLCENGVVPYACSEAEMKRYDNDDGRDEE